MTWAPVEREVAAVVRRSGPSDLPRSVENCQDLSRWSDGMPNASAEARVQQESAATAPTNIDPQRPVKASDLR